MARLPNGSRHPNFEPLGSPGAGGLLPGIVRDSYLVAMATTVSSLAERIKPVLRRYGVTRAGVFGSYARGDAGEGSDLDLLVELPPGSSLLDLVGLQLELSDLLGIEVDANTYKAIHPLLEDRILADQVRIL